MEPITIELKPTGPDVTIRTGGALALRDPVTLELCGTITAPGDFWENRKGVPLDPLHANVLADYSARSITLDVEERDPLGTVVTGVLDLHPALEALTINAQKTYDRGALEKLIKFQAAYFEDRAAHSDLLGALKQFDARVSVSFKNADDYKGVAAQERLTNITHNVPLEFKLAMPIFGGGQVEVFKVDICVGLISGGVDFWLESTQLHELVIEQTDAIFETELKRFEGVVIVKQY